MTVDRLTIDIARDADWPVWASDGAIRSAADAVSRRIGAEGHVDILLTDDQAVRGLNREWRNSDAPTNVLSFPLGERDPGGGLILGDVVLARETVESEAEEMRISPEHHVSHLIVHGILHLLGYDHYLDHEAVRMERLETEILADLGIADPYADPPLEIKSTPRHADA